MPEVSFGVAVLFALIVFDLSQPFLKEDNDENLYDHWRRWSETPR